ncbi:hypothetical protein Hanom_Chr14g01274831 [Helianthus anomalus]
MMDARPRVMASCTPPPPCWSRVIFETRYFLHALNFDVGPCWSAASMLFCRDFICRLSN